MPSGSEKSYLEALQTEENLNKEKIEANRFDETGAEKEVFFHKRLHELIKENITFDKDGQAHLNEDAGDIHLIAVCSRDLKRANKEGGHNGGDTYLKETVQQTKGMLGIYDMEDVNVFHIAASDFIATTRGTQRNVDGFMGYADGKPIKFSENAQPGHLTTTEVSLGEVVNFYNSYRGIAENPKQGSQALFEKTFTGQAFQLLSFRQEQQKLLDIYTDLMVEKSEEAFTLYGAAVFRSQGIETFQQLKTIQNMGDVVFQMAFDRAYGENQLPLQIWQVVENNLGEHTQVARMVSEKALDRATEIEREAIEAEETETPEEIRRNFSLEKSIFTSNLGIVLTNISKYSYELPDQFTTKNLTRLDLVKLGGITEGLINAFWEDPEEQERWKKIQQGLTASITDAHIKYEEEERLGEVLPVEEINQILQTSRDAIDRLRLERDFLTGLKNKQLFEQDLFEALSESDEDIGLVSLDLGFLQYFNNIGGRVTGDLAISKAGYVLEDTVRRLQEQGIKAEAYRPGGDEFCLIVHGGEEATQKAFGMIFEKNSETNEYTENATGLVPRAVSSRKTYIPRMLQFDGSTLNSDEGKQILTDLLALSENANPFSEQDTTVLKKSLEGQDTTPEEKALYTQVLSEIMVRVGDKIIDENKAQMRFEIMFNLYNQTAGRPEATRKQREQFVDLLAFSGKSMNGKTMGDFARTLRYAHSQGFDIENLTSEQYDQLRTSFYQTGEALPVKTPLEDLVEQFAEKKPKA